MIQHYHSNSDICGIITINMIKYFHTNSYICRIITISMMKYYRSSSSGVCPPLHPTPTTHPKPLSILRAKNSLVACVSGLLHSLYHNKYVNLNKI